jgi:predicted transcriptional regulator
MNERSQLKTKLTEVQTTVDSDSGEILDINIKKHTFLANTKEDFLLLYSSMLSVFNDMEQSEIRVLGFLLQYADGTIFSIGKPLRLEIAKVTTLSERTIYNTVKTLVIKQLIYKHSSGAYQVNPRYAFKGSTHERNNQLKILIELGCKDC